MYVYMYLFTTMYAQNSEALQDLKQQGNILNLAYWFENYVYYDPNYVPFFYTNQELSSSEGVNVHFSSRGCTVQMVYCPEGLPSR